MFLVFLRIRAVRIANDDIDMHAHFRQASIVHRHAVELGLETYFVIASIV